MRSIIRCPACFTFVYSDARHCHGCGQRLGKRKLLTRGSWVFIVLAVAGFTVVRGVDLQQERHARMRTEMERAYVVENTVNFMRTWLTAPAEDLTRSLAPRKTFAKDLIALRERHADALPAARIVRTMRLEPRTDQTHSQTGSEPCVHGKEEAPPANRASDPRRPSSTFTSRGRQRRQWNTERFAFSAEIVKNDRTYEISGTVCVDDDPNHEVVCVEIERVTLLDGRLVEAVERAAESR